MRNIWRCVGLGKINLNLFIRGGYGVNGEGVFEYVKFIEYVEEVIGNGKVVFRIYNISILDDGFY